MSTVGKDPTTLLGGIIVRNTLVTYDREHEKVGFLKTNCSELWETIGNTGIPPPTPSDDERKNSSADASPALAPPASQQYNISEGIQVGVITFYMSLNVSYDDLKPHISDLAQSIAHELNVNTSQVHMLNFTAKGNDSLIRWAILPEGSAKYLPIATAMDILARLSERKVELPDSYGSYELFEWQVVPPTKQTWWQRHYMAVIIGIFITFIVGLSASGAFIIWRRRRETQNSYKPVDSAAPEQEMQPL